MAADKMYLRDFVEILEEAGFTFERYGWEYLINVFINHQYFRADESRNKGYIASAEAYEQAAIALQDAKERRGYY